MERDRKDSARRNNKSQKQFKSRGGKRDSTYETPYVWGMSRERVTSGWSR